MIRRAIFTTCLATAALAACTGGGSSEPIFPDGGGSSSSSGASSSSTSSGSSGEGLPLPTSSSSSGAPLATPQTIVTARLSGAQCPDAGTVVMVGYFGQPNAGPPVPEQLAKAPTWQDKSLTLECSVKASGAGFAVTSSMAYDNASVGLNGLTPVGPDGFVADVKVGASEYKHKNCTVDDSANGGVAAGRFWAKIACAAEAGALCAIDAEVRIENCAQQ